MHSHKVKTQRYLHRPSVTQQAMGARKIPKQKKEAKQSLCGVKIPFLELSDDEIIRVLSLLWFQDLYRVISLNVRLRDIVYNNNTLAKYLLTNQVERNKWQCFNADLFCKSLSSRNIVVLASRMPYWPTDIDTSNLRYELEEVNVEGQRSKCVAYAGSILGKNRCFVGNHYFPIFGQRQEGGLQTVADFPFTKPVFDPVINSTIPVLSGIAYFEITIHKALCSSATAHPDFSPCVAIGIANHRHRLNKMPGWDLNSFGFHGDDGCLFRGFADHGVAIDDATFGEGDTVGLGLTYNQLKQHMADEEEFTPFYELFMTKNGQFLSKFVFHRESFSQCTWFPCVGTDCPCPIEMNFGNKGVPFAFDIVQYEKDEVRPPPAPRRSSRAKVGKKKTPEIVAPPAPLPGIAETPTLLFRAPYSAESHYEGGLYRSREFWGQVKAHLDGNDLDTEDEDMWDDDGCSDCDQGSDDGDSEDESVTINGDHGDGENDEDNSDDFSEDEDDYDEFSSDEDSIASESSGELVPDSW